MQPGNIRPVTSVLRQLRARRHWQGRRASGPRDAMPRSRGRAPANRSRPTRSPGSRSLPRFTASRLTPPRRSFRFPGLQPNQGRANTRATSRRRRSQSSRSSLRCRRIPQHPEQSERPPAPSLERAQQIHRVRHAAKACGQNVPESRSSSKPTRFRYCCERRPIRNTHSRSFFGGGDDQPPHKLGLPADTPQQLQPAETPDARDHHVPPSPPPARPRPRGHPAAPQTTAKPPRALRVRLRTPSAIAAAPAPAQAAAHVGDAGIPPPPPPQLLKFRLPLPPALLKLRVPVHNRTPSADAYAASQRTSNASKSRIRSSRSVDASTQSYSSLVSSPLTPRPMESARSSGPTASSSPRE
jgi:hypothetical protein